jgi:hypothetical protein
MPVAGAAAQRLHEGHELGFGRLLFVVLGARAQAGAADHHQRTQNGGQNHTALAALVTEVPHAGHP